MIIRVRTRRQLSVVIDKRFAVFINQTLFLYQMEKLYVFPFPPFCKGGRKIQFVGLSISCHIGHWRINADAPVAASSMGPRILIGCLCCLAPYIQLISLEKSVGITSQFPKLYWGHWYKNNIDNICSGISRNIIRPLRIKVFNNIQR